MSNVKERILGAVTIMSEKDAEKVWNLIQSAFALSNAEEVVPDSEEIAALKVNVDKLYNVEIRKTTKKDYVLDFENLVEEFDYLKDEFNDELSELFQKINKLKTRN